MAMGPLIWCATLERLTKPEKGCRFFRCYRTGMMRVAAKARSGMAFGLYVFLDTSRFGYRLTLLSRTLLLFLRSGSTEPTPRLQPSLSLEEANVKSRTKQSLMKRVN